MARVFYIMSEWCVLAPIGEVLLPLSYAYTLGKGGGFLIFITAQKVEFSPLQSFFPTCNFWGWFPKTRVYLGSGKSFLLLVPLAEKIHQNIGGISHYFPKENPKTLVKLAFVGVVGDPVSRNFPQKHIYFLFVYVSVRCGFGIVPRDKKVLLGGAVLSLRVRLDRFGLSVRMEYRGESLEEFRLVFRLDRKGFYCSYFLLSPYCISEVCVHFLRLF